MEFFTKVLSVNSRLKSERAREAALVNQTFQENLESVKRFLVSEERDNVLALLDMVYDSSFPEEQVFVKTPSRERLNPRKELVVRLLIGLDSLGVPVMSELLVFIKKHGLEGVADSLMVLLELISPLLEGKEAPEFSTDDFVDALDSGWHSTSRTGSPLLNVLASATSSPRASTASVGDLSPRHPLTAGSPYRRALSDRSMLASRAHELGAKSVLDKSHTVKAPPLASSSMPASIQNPSFKQDLCRSSEITILEHPSPESPHVSTDKKSSAYSLDIVPEHVSQKLHRRKSSSLRELFAEDEADKSVQDGSVDASSKRNSSSSSMRRTSSEFSKFIANTASETSSPTNPGQPARTAGSLKTEEKRFRSNFENQDNQLNGSGHKSSRQTSPSHLPDQLAISREDAGDFSLDRNEEDATQNSGGLRADMGGDDSTPAVQKLLKSSKLHTSGKMDDNLPDSSPLSNKSSCESLSDVSHASRSDSAFNRPGEVLVGERQADKGGPGEGRGDLCLVAKQDGAGKGHEYSTKEELATGTPIKQSNQDHQELETADPKRMEDGVLTTERTFHEDEGSESDRTGALSTLGRENEMTVNHIDGDEVGFDDGEHIVEVQDKMNPSLSGNEHASDGHVHGWGAQSARESTYSSREGDDEHNMLSSQIETMARPTSSTSSPQGHITGPISNGSFEDVLKHNDASDADCLSDSMNNGNQRRNSDLTTARALFEQEKLLDTARSGTEGDGEMQTKNMACPQNENNMARKEASEEYDEKTSSSSSLSSSSSSSSSGSLEDQRTASSGSDADKELPEVTNVDDEASRPYEQEFKLQIADTDANARQSYPSRDQGEDTKDPHLSSKKLDPDTQHSHSTSHKEDAGHAAFITDVNSSAGNQAEDVHPSKDYSHEEARDKHSYPKGDAELAVDVPEAVAERHACTSDIGRQDTGDTQVADFEQEAGKSIPDSKASSKGSNEEDSYPKGDAELAVDVPEAVAERHACTPDIGSRQDTGDTQFADFEQEAGKSIPDSKASSKGSNEEDYGYCYPEGNAEHAVDAPDAVAVRHACPSVNGREEAGDTQVTDFEQEVCKSIPDSKASSKGSNEEGYGSYRILPPLLVSSASNVPGVVDQVIARSSQHSDEEAERALTALTKDAGDAHSLQNEERDSVTHADDLQQKGCETAASGKVQTSGSSEGVSLVQGIFAPLLVPAPSNASQFDGNDDASDMSSGKVKTSGSSEGVSLVQGIFAPLLVPAPSNASQFHGNDDASDMSSFTNSEAAEQGLNCKERSGSNEKQEDELHGAISPAFEDLQTTQEAKAAHERAGDVQSKDGQALMKEAVEDTNLCQKIIGNESSRLESSLNTGSSNNENPEPEMPVLNSTEDGNKQNVHVDPQHACHESISKPAALEDHLKVSDDQFDKLLSEVEATKDDIPRRQDSELQLNDIRDGQREIDIADNSPMDQKTEEEDTAGRAADQKSAAKTPFVPAYPLESYIEDSKGSKDAPRDQGSEFSKPSSETSDNSTAKAHCYSHPLPDNNMHTGHSSPPHISDASIEDQSTKVEDKDHQLRVNSRDCGSQCELLVPTEDARESGALHDDADHNNSHPSNLSTSSNTNFPQEDVVDQPAEHMRDMDTDVPRSKRKGKRAGKLARGFLACCAKPHTSHS